MVLAGSRRGRCAGTRAGPPTRSARGSLSLAVWGFLPYANAVHFQQRHKQFHQMIAAGGLPSVGYATDVGAGLVYRGGGAEIEVVVDRPGAAAYRVERGADGQTVEVTLDVTHRLG